MAFYFDIEVAPHPDTGGYKIYCSNITQTWETIKTPQDVQKLVEQLPYDNNAKKKPIPQIQDTTSGYQVSIFLNQLGSTDTCLKSITLHEFLDVPQNIRDGIKWVKDKDFGQKLKGGMVTFHSQKVRRSSAKRYLVLHKDPKVGGSLVMYEKEPNDKSRHINSLKIANATIIKAVTTLDNGFVVNSGKRSWLLQASNTNDFKEWLDQINVILKECGAQLIKLPKELQNQNKSFRPVRPSQSYKYNNVNQKHSSLPINTSSFTDTQDINSMEPEELEVVNNELETRRDQLLENLNELEESIRDIEKYLNEWKHGKKEMNEKFEKEVQEERRKIQGIYDIEKENLKAYLERKKRLLRSKGNIKNTGSKKKKKDKKDQKDLSEYKDEDGNEDFEQTVQIDLEKRLIMKNTPDERKDLRFIHKHLYKHTYKHDHKHIHIHVDSDMLENNPDRVPEMKDSHTVEHTITHTNTQTQVKPGIFG